jgi:transcriptional regulator with XRE-family HTH domain
MQNLTQIKTAHNLNDTELASVLHMSTRQIRRIKKGQSKPGLKFLTALKDAFPEVDIDEFLKQTGGTQK